MQDSKIKKNYIYNACYQVLILIIPLISMPYVSRIIGADGIGKVSYAESVTSYFVLFATMGITTFGQREISYCRESEEKRSEVFWNAKVLEIISATIVGLLFILFSAFQSNRVLYLLLGFNLLSVLFDVTWFFQGVEEFGKIVLRNSIVKILGLICIFTLVKQKSDIYIYVLSTTLFTFIGNVSLWGYLPKYIIFIPLSRIRPFGNLRTVWSLFVPTIATQVYTVLDKTMIGIITKSEFENGYYDQAIMISKMALAIVTALGVVVGPRVAYYFENKNQDELKKLMYDSYRFVWFSACPICFGLMAVSNSFVPWFYGDGFDKVSLLLKVLPLLIIAIGINNITGVQYLIPTKRQNLFTKTVLIGAIVNFPLNIVLISLFNSIGAAIASVVAEIVIVLVQLYLIKDELSVARIIKMAPRYLISAAVMGIVIGVWSIYLRPTVLNTFLLIGLGMILYFGILLLIKDDMLKQMLTKNKQ